VTDVSEIIGQVRAMQQELGTTLDGFGGFLRCESCRSNFDLSPGQAGHYLSNGWPTCCGHTMRWWTQSQIDKGEVTP
jgi:hypothetical protein